MKREREETEAALEKLRANIASYEADITKLNDGLAQYESEDNVKKRLDEASDEFVQASQELELSELLEEQSRCQEQLAAVEQKARKTNRRCYGNRSTSRGDYCS